MLLLVFCKLQKLFEPSFPILSKWNLLKQFRHAEWNPLEIIGFFVSFYILFVFVKLYFTILIRYANCYSYYFSMSYRQLSLETSCKYHLRIMYQTHQFDSYTNFRMLHTI